MTYDATSIKVLEGLEHVRTRPAMYIGSTNARGLNHLVYEIVDNAVDEFAQGYGSTIEVTLLKDGGCAVCDYGRGIPVDVHPSTGVSALRTVLTTLNAGGKFDNNSYKYSSGLHGVGSSVVNALSDIFTVSVFKDGRVYTDSYEKGIPVTRLNDDGSLPCYPTSREGTGTLICFKPDPSIFSTTEFKASDIKSRLHETAYLNPNLTLLFADERVDPVERVTYHEPEGVVQYVRDVNSGESPLCDVHTFSDCVEGDCGPIEVLVCFQYVESLQEKITGFCNNIQTIEGGTHVTALKTVLTNLVNQYARQLGVLKDKDSNFTGPDVRSGFTAVVSVKHPDPQFEGQTKTKLDNSDVYRAVTSVSSTGFQQYFDRHLNVLKKVISVAEKSAKVRKSEARTRQNLFTHKKKYSFDSNGKLAGCESKDYSRTELYIVEGDSAAGSSKMARDRKYQAILPIRGKILNVEKAPVEKILANAEIRTLIYALGCGFSEGYGQDFDIKKLKYDKVILMCFTGDTKVKCLDGNSYSFKELVDNDVKELWVYSRDKQGNIVPALATNPCQTGTTTQLCKVTLDNGRVTRCTPDHLFMLEDGTYKEARYLEPGDSLSALHMKKDNHGYDEYYDDKIRRWRFVHHLVGDTILVDGKTEAQERFEREHNDTYRKTVVIHHKDGNRTNNTPDNLTWLTNREHAKLHNDITSRNITSYNLSDKHRQDVKRAHRDGKYLGKSDFTSNGYNYSKLHNEVIKKVNASRVHVDSAKRGKIGKSIRYLIDNGIEFNQENYDKFKLKGAESYCNILNTFNSYMEAYNYAQNGSWCFDMYLPSSTVKQYDNSDKQRRQIGNVIYKILQDGEEFNRDTYTKYKGTRTVKYDNILKWFCSYDEALEYAKNKNHKVVSVQVLDVPETPVYCLTVAGSRNFCLDDGEFVHNCDGDIDGSHIVTLLLTIFYRLLPEVLYEGHVYIACPPLYKVTPKRGPEKYLYTDKDLIEYRRSHHGFRLQRYKGLGEMNPKQLWETTMNPETRMLKRVIVSDTVRADSITSDLMGSNVDVRRRFIFENAKEANLDV